MQTLAVEYARRAEDRRAAMERAQKRFELIGNLRLAAGLAAAALAFFVFGGPAIHPLWLAVPLGVFFALVILHARIVEQRDLSRRALRFYQQGISRLGDRWMGAGEQGNRFRDPNHVYAEDLDLFGKGSLYELLCTARTRAGEDTLANWLQVPGTPEAVRQRQAAVEELSPKLDLRERLALIGDDIRAGLHADSLKAWGSQAPVTFPAGLPVLAGVLSVAMTVALAGYLTGFTGPAGRAWLMACLLVNLSVALWLRRRVQDVVHGVELPSHDLALLTQLLQAMEREPAHAPLLLELQNRLSTGGAPASDRIAALRTLATRQDWSHNEFFKPIAALLFWSTQLAVAIERWRKDCGPAIPGWIAAAGEFEALCALAAYHAEHPSDVWPEFSTREREFSAQGLGHPLLPESHAIRNDVHLGADLPLLVVSGSNMSGKSTLLRAIGLNIALAWAGAPVRARRLVVSPLQVAASIRVQDSLQDGRSRFYAEILRLRQVVELTSGELPVLFLLDELLSGTNSHDRQIGATAIVKSMVARGAIGLLTTHDLALAPIAAEVQPQGRNVHFADTIVDGRLHFDYQLAPGVVERSNALELMRSVGLEV